MNIQQAHAEHIERCRAAGKTIVTYRITTCGHMAQSVESSSSIRWSTVATCIECGKLYIKVTEGSTIITREME